MSDPKKFQPYRFDPDTGIKTLMTPEEVVESDRQFKEKFTPCCTLRGVFAMRVKASLEPLMKSGGIISMADGYRVVLADVSYNGHMLWWYEAFGREHLLQVDGMQMAFPWRQMMSGQTIVATIGQLEGSEDEGVWRAWKEFLQTPEGLHVAASIAELKAQAANSRE